MSNRCKNRIPVFKGIAVHYLFHKFRFGKVRQVNAFCLTITVNGITAADDIILFHLGLEPLIDLIFCLCAAYQLQPVAAWSLGILGGDDLNTVTILDLIFNRNQFSIDSGAYHLISYRTVDGISKINRSRAAWKSLYITGRSETVNTVREQVQITLYHA